MAFTALCLLLIVPQVGDVLTSEQPTGSPSVEDLIRQLDSDRFAERRAASQRLAEVGPSAFGELSRAAAGSSAEVQERAMQILGDHFRNGESTVREAAEQALTELAKSDTPAGRKASAILKPPQADIASQQAQQQLQIRQIQIAQIQARIAAQRALPRQAPAIPAGGNVNRRIRVSTNGRKISIDIQGEKITVEIEETKDGKQVTRKIEAKNAEDLRKKDPEAYKAYEKYAGRRFAPVGPFKLAPAAPAPAKPPIQAGAKQRILDALKASETRLDAEVKAAKEKLQGDELQRALDSIELRRGRIQEARQRYEKMQAG